MNQSVPGVLASWIAMIWSNFVAGSALSAIAAAAGHAFARERMSATMISLPSPFILAKGARAIGQSLVCGWRLYGGIASGLPVRGCLAAIRQLR